MKLTNLITSSGNLKDKNNYTSIQTFAGSQVACNYLTSFLLNDETKFQTSIIKL